MVFVNSEAANGDALYKKCYKKFVQYSQKSRVSFLIKLQASNLISYKEKDRINKVKCFGDGEVVENFYSDLPKINIGWKSNN